MNGRKVFLTVLVVLMGLGICGFIPEDGLPDAQTARYGQQSEEMPTEEEVLAWIAALPEIDWEGDDEDIAYCWEGICYTWAEVYEGQVPEDADEAMIRSIHCEAVYESNSWSPLTGCPKPGWVK